MKWEEIVADLPSLLQENNKVRSVIDGLDVLDLDETILGDVRELRRAYSILGFMAHAYIWASGTPGMYYRSVLQGHCWRQHIFWVCHR